MQGLISFFFCICLSTSIYALTDEQRTKYRSEVLTRHNYWRGQYCAGDLVRNSTLEQEAQKYCDDMATSGNFAHSNRTDAGENSYQHTPFDSKNNGATPVEYWVAERSNYTSATPHAALHFTQVVWKATKSIGVGVCSIPNNGLMFVANYFPRGNYENQFKDNVGCGNQ